MCTLWHCGTLSVALAIAAFWNATTVDTLRLANASVHVAVDWAATTGPILVEPTITVLSVPVERSTPGRLRVPSPTHRMY
jgi:hypothetical protein